MFAAVALVVVGASAVATRAATTISADRSVAEGKTFDYIIAGTFNRARHPSQRCSSLRAQVAVSRGSLSLIRHVCAG